MRHSSVLHGSVERRGTALHEQAYERVWLRQVHGAIHYVIDFRLAVSDLDTMREVHGIVGFGLGSTLVYIKLKIGV